MCVGERGHYTLTQIINKRWIVNKNKFTLNYLYCFKTNITLFYAIVHNLIHTSYMQCFENKIWGE